MQSLIPKTMTIEEAKNIGILKLSEAGITDASVDVYRILEEVRGINRGYVLAHPKEMLDSEGYPDAQQRFLDMLAMRTKRIPLQHILGYEYFMSLKFEVTPDTLIPRPDTEILVEEVLRDMCDGMRFLDMCTGSGCILTSILFYTNSCEGVGADISAEALAIAKKNADELLKGKEGISYSFCESDLFEKVEGKYDIIVSNPPYIATKVIADLEKEVKDFDPMLALDGGDDGLSFYRRIIAQAPDFLTAAGRIYFEIGYDQGEAVREMLIENGFDHVEIIKDYAGLDRVVKAGRKICLIN